MNETSNISLFSIREENGELTKFSPETGTCFNKNIKGVISGFSKQFQDSFFYANVIQFLLVALMYYKAGNGRYWKILLYASIAGCVAGILENFTVAVICREGQEGKNGIVVPFLIDELFWTTQQYSVPLLNLTKMETIAWGPLAKYIKYFIVALLFPFIFFKFYIGYERMMSGYLVDEKISSLHGFAFGTIAIADLVCSVSIIYFINKHKNSITQSKTSLSNQVKQSSYTILLAVDMVEFFLSIFDIIANTGIAEDVVPAAVATPFQCLMSNFILILSTDALLLKYNVNSRRTSVFQSSGIQNSAPINNNSFSRSAHAHQNSSHKNVNNPNQCAIDMPN
ncbi:hypothetical protein PIROE2DRAFT_4406 [Piromyces sp. E2]|nr:hypothetical protein PIROE2DRAFT_4406 [Piromyces sp. E2]|eukprot:OUM67989.1 hypothetical protein PIROE2DRAFT_4406 [Piromyces sp. E2]